MTSPSTYRRMKFLENNLALFLIAVSVIIAERVVKFYVTENLRIGESIPVLGNFLMITRSENIGAGFGILQGWNWLFVGAACIVFILLIVYYNRIIYNNALVFATALVLGGTVGNMMDRLFFGCVIDYIDFSFWPTFNLSDTALVIGIILFVVNIYTWNKRSGEKGRYEHY